MTSERRTFLRTLGLVVVAAMSWGTWSLFLRPSGIAPSVTAPLVLVVMGLSLLPLRRLDDVTPRWDRGTLLLLLALGVSDAVNIATYFAAMSVSTLGVAVLSHYLTPLLVALAAPYLDGERVKGARTAAFVATCGLALVLEPWQGAGDGARWQGAVLGAISAVGYAGNVFLATRLVPRIGATRTVGYHAFVSAALLLPFASRAAWETVTPRGAALVVVAAITLGAISGWLFSRGLPIIGPTLASTIAFLEPLVAVVVGFLAWGERLSAIAVVGAALILAAGAWVARSRGGG